VSASEISSDLAGKAVGGRRLIAVVYADMVGYSWLISLDDAGTFRRLRTLRRALIDPAKQGMRPLADVCGAYRRLAAGYTGNERRGEGRTVAHWFISVNGFITCVGGGFPGTIA
jgi:hypothetical protein